MSQNVSHQSHKDTSQKDKDLNKKEVQSTQKYTHMESVNPAVRVYF